VFPATSSKRENADEQKIDDSNNISGRSHEIHLALSSKNGRTSENPNLPIDDRGKIILLYKNDETPINKRMIGFTLGVEPN